MQSTLVHGALAPVWIAANYEKKLSKQHSLHTDLVATAGVVKSSAQRETITLRVSGQLLLGIVRIYSRKTKYLLDDVNDILYRLKNSFKFASGGVKLGNNGAVHASSETSVIRDLNAVLLRDQVGAHDLLWQDDLRLDAGEADVGVATFFGNRTASADVFDQAVEIGRFGDDDDIHHDNVDIELDFDLGDADRSVEMGRDAGLDVATALQPHLDLGKDLDIDLGAPLDVVDDVPDMAVDVGGSPAPEEPATPEEPRPRRTIVGISEAGVVRTTKRKLVVDETSVLEDDATESELRRLQLSEDNLYITAQLSDQEKLRLIHELAEPVGFKRRKVWSLDERLTAVAEHLAEQDEPEVDFQDDDLNFDISLPTFDEEIPQEAPEGPDSITIDAVNSTKQVSDIIRETNQLTLDDILEKDAKSVSPLGLKIHGDAKYLDMRKQAAASFFELLVLATSDCISLKQDEKIQVQAKDRLFSKFL